MTDTTGNSKRSEITSKLEALRLKREELEVVKLEDEVAALQSAREALKANRTRTEAELADFKRRTLDRQAYCNHRKGGMDLEGLNGNGNRPEHAIAKHQLSDGRVMVLCLRCHKQWLPGDLDHSTMLRAHTDNVMSTSVQFSGIQPVDVHQFQDAAQDASQ